jgi:hypothetical protein
MVNVFASSAVDRGLEPRFCQTTSIKEKEQRLIDNGSLDIVSYDAGADDINVESISGRRSSENSITRITVNVHTDSQQADDEMCVRISDISCQRNYGRDNENL